MARSVGDVRIDTRGLDLLEQRFQPRARRAVQGLSEGIVADTKQACPVRTGRLRDSYDAEWTGPIEMHVGTDVEYAPYVEFGTSRMGAQPHFAPAVERARQRLPQIVAELFET